MMKDILIIAHFTQSPGEIGAGRFHYIAKRLGKEEHIRVEIVTTSFSHESKTQRKISKKRLEELGYKFTMLYEPGYKKNVSIKRLYSHFIMGKHLKKYLAARNQPDIIYCAIPSLDVAGIAADYASKHHIRFIIDIQDLWPEAFSMVMPIPVVSGLILKPIALKADHIYRQADEIIGVSETYVNRARQVNTKCKEGSSVFIGTHLENFDKLAKQYAVPRREENIVLVYIGTLGHSYDLTCVIDALVLFKAQGISNLKFLVMGDGPLRSQFEDYSKKKGIQAEFTGNLSYGTMAGRLAACDIAVNPITHGAAQSIINKHGDYAAAALPVLNTQECPEYRNLVEAYQMGLNCENSNAEDLAEKLLTLYKDENLRKTMGNNSRRLAEQKFDRKNSYNKILHLLKG